MCLQEMRSRRTWQRSCSNEADMTVNPLPSLRARSHRVSLFFLFADCIVSPPHPSSLRRTSDAALISRCSLWVAHSIHYSSRQVLRLDALLQCAWRRLSCRLHMHEGRTCWNQHACAHVLKCSSRPRLQYVLLMLLLWTFLQGRMRWPGSCRSHDLPGSGKKILTCNWFTFDYKSAFWAFSMSRHCCCPTHPHVGFKVRYAQEHFTSQEFI